MKRVKYPDELKRFDPKEGEEAEVKDAEFEEGSEASEDDLQSNDE